MYALKGNPFHSDQACGDARNRPGSWVWLAVEQCSNITRYIKTASGQAWSDGFNHESRHRYINKYIRKNFHIPTLKLSFVAGLKGQDLEGQKKKKKKKKKKTPTMSNTPQSVHL